MGDALTHRATKLIRTDLPLEEMCRKLDVELRRELDYDVAAWSTLDPATGLTTACILCGIPEDPARESQLFQHEFRDGEPSTYLGLVREGRTTAILTEETDGDLSRASRWDEVFSHFGVTDELRTITWADDRPWGAISLYSMSRTFTAEDASTMDGLGPVVGDGIRLNLLRTAATRPAAIDDPPGILRVGVSGEIEPMTEPARGWLDLGGHALRSAARVAAAAVLEHADWQGATSRVVADDGRVLALHAANTVDADGAVAVIVEAARKAQVGAMLVDAYGLTGRQRDVLGLLLLGRSMTQLARELGISEHTANDHRKAIYTRMKVNSRSELAALLQHEHYQPRSLDHVQPSPYGGFLDG